MRRVFCCILIFFAVQIALGKIYLCVNCVSSSSWLLMGSVEQCPLHFSPPPPLPIVRVNVPQRTGPRGETIVEEETDTDLLPIQNLNLVFGHSFALLRSKMAKLRTGCSDWILLRIQGESCVENQSPGNQRKSTYSHVQQTVNPKGTTIT